MSVEARRRWAKIKGIAEDSSIFKQALQLADALTPSEGGDVFERVVNGQFSRVAVATRDLGRMIEHNKESVQLAFIKAVEEVARSETSHPRPELSSVYVAPRNNIERNLADIWRQLLGFDGVGIHDDFFELGGHSLLATQVMSRIRDTFKVESSLRTLFEHPTVAGLAEQILRINGETKL